jgi:hypothetical protein
MEVEADRITLKSLADTVGGGSDHLKEFGAWLSEKVSRIKLNSDSHSLGAFEALEFLALGIPRQARTLGCIEGVAASRCASTGHEL